RDAPVLRSDAPLLSSDAALPIRNSSKRKRQDQHCGQAGDENVAPPSSLLSAPSNESLRLLSRRRRSLWLRTNPPLGLLQRRRAQEQPCRAFRQRPATCQLAKVRVLPDPVDVGVERLGQPICALLELRFIIEEDETQLR